MVILHVNHQITGGQTCADPEGGIGSGPLENNKFLGFLSNTGPDHLENYKATKPVFNVGPSSTRHWRFAGGSFMARF